jgi:hypothetical protein
MSVELLKQAIEQAGLTKSFELIDLDKFLSVIESVGIDDSIQNGSFYRFLEATLRPHVIPATWQKLADLGWSDDDIAGLVSGNILTESSATLVSAINLGALSVDEFNEFARFPNQEVEIFYYSNKVKKVLAFLREHMTLPKIGLDAFAGKD